MLLAKKREQTGCEASSSSSSCSGKRLKSEAEAERRGVKRKLGATDMLASRPAWPFRRSVTQEEEEEEEEEEEALFRPLEKRVSLEGPLVLAIQQEEERCDMDCADDLLPRVETAGVTGYFARSDSELDFSPARNPYCEMNRVLYYCQQSRDQRK
jgi:hypothetical protein